MRHPVLMVRWCWVSYPSGFLCVSCHYLIFPRVSSLLVQGLGVSAPTPKAQGLISGQEWRFHKRFLMALRENKVNIQQWEIKDEPQMNGNYKIRQIIIKIVKYTHIRIYPWAKWKRYKKKIKYIRLIQRTKEIKNYIYQLRTKLTKAQTGKQN